MSEQMNRPASAGSGGATDETIKRVAGCVGFIGGGCGTLLMVVIVAAIHFLIKYW